MQIIVIAVDQVKKMVIFGHGVELALAVSGTVAANMRGWVGSLKKKHTWKSIIRPL